ncbi:MAG: hypothetical protein ACJ75J_09515 [Cytophagaceae bacterium]
MNQKVTALIFLTLPFAAFAQKIKEGSTPVVKVYLVQGDSAVKATYLKKNTDNRIRVVVEGGIEQTKHLVVVTSKDASVKSVPDVKNEFLIKPETDAPCEIIVDLKTFEPYHDVKITNLEGGKKVKHLVKKYPPKTYMIGYEKYKVR